MIWACTGSIMSGSTVISGTYLAGFDARHAEEAGPEASVGLCSD